MARAACVVVVLTGCYTPQPPVGQECTAENHCPPGQSCDLGTVTCVDEPSPAARFTQIEAGADHTCALDDAGAAWCWGRNDFGELGLGLTGMPRTAPVRVIGGHIFTTLALGDKVSCGIDDGRTLWCWGELSGHGLLMTPGQVAKDVTAVSVGIQGGYCQLNDPTSLECSFGGVVPAQQQLDGLVPKAIGANSGTMCFIATDDRLYCFGANDLGAAGQPTATPTVAMPTEVKPGLTFLSVAVGNKHACAIAAGHELWCWGRCERGQTGSGSASATGCAPARVDGFYLAVDAIDSTTCAIRADQRMVCFGTNDRGQLGSRGDFDRDPSLAEMPVFDAWEQIAAGQEHACALRDKGEAWCWGDNEFGQLGDGRGAGDLAPVDIDAGDWKSIALGNRTSCGIRPDGTLWCWGMNGYGQLGDGTVIPRDRPHQSGADTDWVAIAPGRQHTCAIRAGGTLWCWGNGENSETGVGSQENVLQPRQVSTRTGWTKLASGDQQSCAIINTELDCWGTSQSAVPAPVGQSEAWAHVSISREGPGGTDGESITAVTRAGAVFSFHTPTIGSSMDTGFDSFSNGTSHGCGLKGGDAYCIGSNTFGEIGNGAPGQAVTALTLVVDGHTFTSIAAGNAVTCAVEKDDSLYCWGDLPRVGLAAAKASQPTRMLAPHQFRTVALGDDHGCAVQNNGHLWCWGSQEFGMRGDGIGSSDRPRRVAPVEP